MPRRKIIPDTEVFAIIRNLIAAEGEKSASFGAVARATGLAAPTLAQRYKTQDAMVRAAFMDGWDILDRSSDAAEAGADRSSKSIPLLLKSLQSEVITLYCHGMRDAELRERAANWRERLESAIALRLGSGAKAQENAAMIFALWQGQLLWHGAGVRGFKLKDALKRLD